VDRALTCCWPMLAAHPWRALVEPMTDYRPETCSQMRRESASGSAVTRVGVSKIRVRGCPRSNRGQPGSPVSASPKAKVIERMARAQPSAAPGEVVHNQVGPPAWACVSATQVDGIRQIASDIITVNGPASVLPG